MRRCSGGRNPGRSSRQPRAGFTLLEVIVVLAIFAVVSFAILEAYSTGQKTADSGIALQKMQTDADQFVNELAYDLRYAATNYSKDGYDPNFYRDSESGNYETAGSATYNSLNWSGNVFLPNVSHASIRYWKIKGYDASKAQPQPPNKPEDGILFTDYFYVRPVAAESNVRNGLDDNNNGLVDECYLERRYESVENPLFLVTKAVGGTAAGSTTAAVGYVEKGTNRVDGGFQIKWVAGTQWLMSISLTLKKKDPTSVNKPGKRRILEAKSETTVHIRG